MTTLSGFYRLKSVIKVSESYLYKKEGWVIMKITAQEEYGLRCILQLAHYPPGEPVSVSEIAEKEGLSTDYVTKLLALLRRTGLVESLRGVKGGYTLAKKPEDILLIEILQALDDSFFYQDGGGLDLCKQFPGKLEECTHTKHCGIRPVWITLMRYIHTVFGHISLAHLLSEDKDLLNLKRESLPGAIKLNMYSEV